MTTIYTPFELETRGWSQIQEDKDIFPDRMIRRDSASPLQQKIDRFSENMCGLERFFFSA